MLSGRLEQQYPLGYWLIGVGDDAPVVSPSLDAMPIEVNWETVEVKVRDDGGTDFLLPEVRFSTQRSYLRLPRRPQSRTTSHEPNKHGCIPRHRPASEGFARREVFCGWNRGRSGQLAPRRKFGEHVLRGPGTFLGLNRRFSAETRILLERARGGLDRGVVFTGEIRHPLYVAWSIVLGGAT